MNKLKRFKIILLTSVGCGIFTGHEAYAFTKLKNGFESITNTYLLPLTGAVGGAALITYILLSFFKQEKFQEKAAAVVGLSIFSAAGLEIISTVTQTFS